jgi:hypothetical protein
MGYGTWQLMVANIPGPGDPDTLAAYFDRAAALNGILLPMLMSIIVGLILAALAARRSGLLPGWVPALLIVVAIFDFVASSTELGANKWTHVVTWSAALVALSYAGATVLRMSDQAWADLYPRAEGDCAAAASSTDPARLGAAFVSPTTRP